MPTIHSTGTSLMYSETPVAPFIWSCLGERDNRANMHQYLEMPVKGKCDGKGPRASTLQPPPAPAPAPAPVPKRAPWMRRARPVLHGNSLPDRSRTPSPAASENPSAAVCWMWLSSSTHANAHGIAAWPHGSNYRELLVPDEVQR